MVSEQEMRFEINGPNDGFLLTLRRQGWHLIDFKPFYADPRVIRPHTPIVIPATIPNIHGMYEALSDTTIRKLLRAIVTKPRTEAELGRMCGDRAKLDDALTFFSTWRIVELSDGAWRKGTACAGIDDIGATLEWCVAEWFRRKLEAPARHGVTIEEVPSGDLDVVAFLDSVRIMVECKSGNPKNIDKDQLKQFVQRTDEFRPEIAVLLVDTESAIGDTIIAKLDSVLSELKTARPEKVVGLVQPFFMPSWSDVHSIEGVKGLYWSAPNIYVTNVRESIDVSLSSILRLYYSYTRHLSYNDTTPVKWPAITSFDKDSLLNEFRGFTSE